MKEKDITTIQLKKETKTNLNEVGSKGETYDDIVKRLVLYDVKLDPKVVKEARKQLGAGLKLSPIINSFLINWTADQIQSKKEEGLQKG